MNEHYFAILRRLFILRRMGNNDIVLERILGPFGPSGDMKKAKLAINELRKFGLVISPKSMDRISINPDRIEDVIRLLNPDTDAVIKNIKPLEESIPKIYHKVPFLTTEGSHRVKGVTDTYSFHRNRLNNDDIVVFLVCDNQKKNTIHIGSIYDPKSLYRRALLGLHSKFKQRVFTKALMVELGKDIVGNRQPPKALIDIMIYDGFVIPIDEKHFQLTSKSVPQEKSIKNYIPELETKINKSISVKKTKEKS